MQCNLKPNNLSARIAETYLLTSNNYKDLRMPFSLMPAVSLRCLRPWIRPLARAITVPGMMSTISPGSEGESANRPQDATPLTCAARIQMSLQKSVSGAFCSSSSLIGARSMSGPGRETDSLKGSDRSSNLGGEHESKAGWAHQALRKRSTAPVRAQLVTVCIPHSCSAVVLEPRSLAVSRAWKRWNNTTLTTRSSLRLLRSLFKRGTNSLKRTISPRPRHCFSVVWTMQRA
jgi:hypothetical protein